MDIEKILRYLNPRRHNDSNYTVDDIKNGHPVDERLCWGITKDDNVLPNLFFNAVDGNWWVRTYVENDEGEEQTVEFRLNTDIVAYVELTYSHD